MPNIPNLIAANQKRWETFHFTTSRVPAFGAVATQLVEANRKAQYEEIAKKVWGKPEQWALVAVIDSREHEAALGLCNSYLGNGQALGHVTTIQPKGRGPFLNHPTDPPLQGAFYRGGLDALIDVQQAPQWFATHGWAPGSALTFLESLNGFGYANGPHDASTGITYPPMPSPYIWGGTNQQQPGKYVSDGVFDKSVMDTQLGCAGLLRYMAGLDPSVPYGAPTAPQPVPVPPVLQPQPPVTPMPTPPANPPMPNFDILGLFKILQPIIPQLLPILPNIVAVIPPIAPLAPLVQVGVSIYQKTQTSGLAVTPQFIADELRIVADALSPPKA
jgi:lysozyme family protein